MGSIAAVEDSVIQIQLGRGPRGTWRRGQWSAGQAAPQSECGELARLPHGRRPPSGGRTPAARNGWSTTKVSSSSENWIA
uniref:Uncharacterized protein n=1 Tax=Physcomitrium patens TaxID=3218 RepID=A0A2K1JG56_PHYPA|nr:hypothetical protein PHYPA_017935 [Physcomitrium patens]